MSSVLRRIQQCRWHGFDSVNELEQAATDAILRAARAAIRQRGAFHIVLAGGTTPRRVYEMLRQEAADWPAWHVYFGDERCLPPDHAERNSQMAEQAWLKHVAIPRTQIHVIPAERGAQQAAEDYNRMLANIDDFDLVLLGLGEDGHTASLFPGHDLGSGQRSSAVLAVAGAPKPPPERVSLSAARLSAARQVIFLVTGDAKKQAVSAWHGGVMIPAAAVMPAGGVDIYVTADLLASQAGNSGRPVSSGID